MIFICIEIVTVVGIVDYLTGYETFFFIYYLLAVFLATWFVGKYFGTLTAALSVAAWVSANLAGGAHYSSYFVPVWNALIMFAFYLVVVMLVAKLRGLQQGLEERVSERTAELTRETQERIRLQGELLETSEREQRRIGRELHDGLCQHLTGTAMMSQAFAQKLAEKSLPESTEATRMVTLVEQAIELTRSLSRGLNPIDLKAGGLLDNLQELAAETSKHCQTRCQVEGHQIVPLQDADIAGNLFRIAQEAVANAVRHGQAKNINLGFDYADEEIVLTITDDGSGIPENPSQDGQGLRNMAYRAEMIGAVLQIERISSSSGTRVTCILPVRRTPKNSHAH